MNTSSQEPLTGAARGEEGGPAPEGARVFEDNGVVNGSGEEFTYTQPVRNTRMGGLTWPVAVCDLCGVVRPHATRWSRRGTHGEWYYSHPHPLSFIILESSNTGRRWYRIEGRPDQKIRPILEKAGRAWEGHIKGYEDILSYLSEVLGPGPMEAGGEVRA